MIKVIVMFGIGLGELILIAIVGLLLFGGKLPDVAYDLGRWARKLQRGLQDLRNDIEDQIRK